MTQIAKNIAAYRTAAGETQGDLGSLLGVTDKAISKWESAQTEPNLDAVVKIAEHYKVTVGELLGVSEKHNGGLLKDLPEDMPERIQKIGGAAWDAAEAVYKALPWQDFSKDNSVKAVPPLQNPSNRMRIRMNGDKIYMFSVSEPDMNLTLAQFQNEANFAWVKDTAENLAEYFKLYSDPDGLRLIYAMSHADFPAYFTADFAAKKAGIPTEKAEELLKMLKNYDFDGGDVESQEAELCEGKVTVYEHCMSGLPLAMASLAHLVINDVDVNVYNTDRGFGMIYKEENDK